MLAGNVAVSARVTAVVTAALIVAVLAAAFAVDPAVAAAFDAPKRVLVASSIAVAALALLFAPTCTARGPWPATARWAAIAGSALVIWVAIATLQADAMAAAFDQSRWMLLLAMVVVVGASPVLNCPARSWLAGAASFGVVGNALLSGVQTMGFGPDFTVAGTGGRFDTGALLGNEGYVALACALLGAAASAVLWTASSLRVRAVAIAAIGLSLVVMVINQQRTSLLAWAIAAMVVVLALHRPNVLRRLALGAASVGLLATLLLVSPWRPMSGPALLDRAEIERLEQLTTFRVGAWAAAAHMIETRPGFGHGPASFAAQSQIHRQAVESAWRQRLNVPSTATVFAQAHQEYLQLAAECGIPAFLALAVLMLALGEGLLRIVADARSPAMARREALVLLAILAAGAVSALAWFPMQIPFTALILLWAAGRAWRLAIEAEDVQ
jgi:O-antigen ligase